MSPRKKKHRRKRDESASPSDEDDLLEAVRSAPKHFRYGHFHSENSRVDRLRKQLQNNLLPRANRLQRHRNNQAERPRSNVKVNVKTRSTSFLEVPLELMHTVDKSKVFIITKKQPKNYFKLRRRVSRSKKDKFRCKESGREQGIEVIHIIDEESDYGENDEYLSDEEDKTDYRRVTYNEAKPPPQKAFIFSEVRMIFEAIVVTAGCTLVLFQRSVGIVEYCSRLLIASLSLYVFLQRFLFDEEAKYREGQEDKEYEGDISDEGDDEEYEEYEDYLSDEGDEYETEEN